MIADQPHEGPITGAPAARRHFRKPLLTAAELGIPERPFATGDVVVLKSGGFWMTVTEVRPRECCEGECVDVVFASTFSGELILEEKHLPATCLQLVDPQAVAERASREIGDNIPF